MGAANLSRIVRWVALAAALSALASCGGNERSKETAEEAAENFLRETTGKDADVKLDGGNLKIEGEDYRHESTATAEWPADMFEGVPRFTFGTVERVTKGEEGGMTKFNIFFRDVEPEGADRYAELLKAKGWTANVTAIGPNGAMVTGQRGDLGMNLMLSAGDRRGMLAVFTGTGAE